MNRIIVMWACVIVAFSTVATAGDGTIRRAKKPRANSYIAVLNEGISEPVDVIVDDMKQMHHASVVSMYRYTFKGFSFEASEATARAIARDPRIKFIEEDGEATIATTAVPRSWAVDRLDNRVSPRLDGSYTYCSSGRGVRVYVVDTGIWGGHDEFRDPLTAAMAPPSRR